MSEKTLGKWRQGDVIVNCKIKFLHIEGKNVDVDTSGPHILMHILTPVKGFVVLTQTCDIVRDVKERPYVELCPLKVTNNSDYSLAILRKTPRYAHIPVVDKLPELKENFILADLDRIFTVEKNVISGIPHLGQYDTGHDKILGNGEELAIHGVAGSKEEANFAADIARKRSRFAFPDEFHDVVAIFVNVLKLVYLKKKYSEIRKSSKSSIKGADIPENCQFLTDSVIIAKKYGVQGATDKELHRNVMRRMAENAQELFDKDRRQNGGHQEIIVVADWEKTPCYFRFIFVMRGRLADDEDIKKWHLCGDVWASLITNAVKYNEAGRYIPIGSQNESEQEKKFLFEWRSEGDIRLSEYRKGYKLDLDHISIRQDSDHS